MRILGAATAQWPDQRILGAVGWLLVGRRVLETRVKLLQHEYPVAGVELKVVRRIGDDVALGTLAGAGRGVKVAEPGDTDAKHAVRPDRIHEQFAIRVVLERPKYTISKPLPQNFYYQSINQSINQSVKFCNKQYMNE